jgi:hypothetical protein
MGKKRQSEHIKICLENAQLLKKLKNVDLVKSFIQGSNDTTVHSLLSMIANLIHNTKISNHPLLKKKLPKLKKKMSANSKLWLKVTNHSKKNSKFSRKFLVNQAGSGVLMDIVTCMIPILPLLL